MLTVRKRWCRPLRSAAGCNVVVWPHGRILPRHLPTARELHHATGCSAHDSCYFIAHTTFTILPGAQHRLRRQSSKTAPIKRIDTALRERQTPFCTRKPTTAATTSSWHPNQNLISTISAYLTARLAHQVRRPRHGLIGG